MVPERPIPVLKVECLNWPFADGDHRDSDAAIRLSVLGNYEEGDAGR